MHGLDSPDGSQLGLGEVGRDERVSHLRTCKVKTTVTLMLLVVNARMLGSGMSSRLYKSSSYVIQKDRVIFVVVVSACVTCLISIHS